MKQLPLLKVSEEDRKLVEDWMRRMNKLLPAWNYFQYACPADKKSTRLASYLLRGGKR